MLEKTEQHNMDILELKSHLDAISVKLDTNSAQYLEKLNRIEVQTIKTNGRVTTMERIIWSTMGGGSVLLLLPTLQAILHKLAN